MADLTGADAAVANAERALKFGVDDNVQLKLIRYLKAGSYESLTPTLLENWHFGEMLGGREEQYPVTVVDVDEDSGLVAILRKCTGVVLYPAGAVYKNVKKDQPVGETRTWNLIVAPTGEYVS